MTRRLAALAAVSIAVAVVAPTHAATKPKPKPKPIKGSYTLNLNPDPTAEITGNLEDGCSGLIAASKNSHPFTVPAAGQLYIHLVSPDPTGAGVTDWDLWLKDGSGAILEGSHDETSDEEITRRFKKKTPLIIDVCNLLGMPSATVSYVFTYA